MYADNFSIKDCTFTNNKALEGTKNLFIGFTNITITSTYFISTLE